jgi:uncharacterized phage protein (TIGR01671 family)
MREIKFRAWDGKEMLTGFYLMPADIIVPPAWRKNVGRDVTWMQYTGLKDAKGVEIYEEDVVRSIYDEEVGVIKHGQYQQVTTGADYMQNYGWHINCGNHNHTILGVNDIPYFEVIGNIYGNPELLNTPLPQ